MLTEEELIKIFNVRITLKRKNKSGEKASEYFQNETRRILYPRIYGEILDKKFEAYKVISFT